MWEGKNVDLGGIWGGKVNVIKTMNIILKGHIKLHNIYKLERSEVFGDVISLQDTNTV